MQAQCRFMGQKEPVHRGEQGRAGRVKEVGPAGSKEAEQKEGQH